MSSGHILHSFFQAQEAAMEKANARREEHLTNLKLRANKMAVKRRSNSNENQVTEGSPAKKAC